MNYRQARFTLDGIDRSFVGWTDESLWNGFAVAKFERVEADLVAATGDADAGVYDSVADAYTFPDAGGGVSTCPAERIATPAGERVVYEIPWTWYEEPESQEG